MRFVRENLFYVILVAVVVIGCGAAVFYYVGSEIGDTINLRAKASRSLGTLAKKKLKVNEQAVIDMKERIDLLAKANKGDGQACVKFNRQHLPVMRLPLSLASSMLAFPIDVAKYKELSLELTFINEYRKQLELVILRPGLLPTSPPTPTEIAAEETKLAEKFTDPGEARLKATQSVKLSKSNAGLIYVDLDALDSLFPPGARKAQHDRLWEAQVNLWVTNEIIQAIITTNQQWLAEQKAPGVPDVAIGVPRSAIKQLVKVTINESMARSQTSVTPVTLTERKTGGEYVVVPYSFTVVMPTRHIRRLCRTLETQNYHTVTNIALSQVGPTAKLDYYYGVEPVMETRMEGELLLLADWVRPLLPSTLARYVPGGPVAK